MKHETNNPRSVIPLITMHSYCVVFFFVVFLVQSSIALSTTDNTILDIASQLQDIAVKAKSLGQIKVQEDVTSLVREFHKAKVLSEQSWELRLEEHKNHIRNLL